MPVAPTVLSSHHELRLGWSLAAVAGVLNATGFCVAGVFSGNMTGNITSLADNMASGEVRSVLTLLTLIAMFIAGATLSAVLLELRGPTHAAEACAIILMTEAVLLVVLAVADVTLRTGSGPVLVFGLGFLMGFQNAAAAVVSNFRVRTTHFSGTSTDIGVNLGAIVAHALQRKTLTDRDSHIDGLKHKVMAMTAFCAGGVIGAGLYALVGEMTLLISALGIVFLSIPPLLQSVRRKA
ncbi:hypothetical protein LMG28614_03250 [Paraburkholderia ultramafica]|uniref:DUF1275 domain-containing protein n=1 Tax=Paraburkholderia ultramafica TaxID=1544867 RepID=A0A6S7BK46_9BURK|nr:YoaK family protein [Paraburkholderia ultramafica]CAB3791210.1 hypothetical protein LMG28614_03250 [Paraburkholderia ultramafica]